MAAVEARKSRLVSFFMSPTPPVNGAVPHAIYIYTSKLPLNSAILQYFSGPGIEQMRVFMVGDQMNRVTGREVMALAKYRNKIRVAESRVHLRVGAGRFDHRHLGSDSAGGSHHQAFRPHAANH